MPIDDLEQELKVVAAEVMVSLDLDEAQQRLRGLATQVATRTAQNLTQINAKQRQTDSAFRKFLAQHGEDLLDDPEIMKRVQAREAYLMRALPGLSDEQRWHRAANDVRRSYGDANQRVIRGMRQGRFGARYSSDPESYQFDAGSDEVPDDGVLEAQDAEIQADRADAIMKMRVANMGRVNEVDKSKFNEKELRRRQRGGG